MSQPPSKKAIELMALRAAANSRRQAEDFRRSGTTRNRIPELVRVGPGTDP